MNEKVKNNQKNRKISLNFWQLSFLIFGSVGIPGILFGDTIAKQHGVNDSILSIGVGNLVIWLIGMIVVSMAAEKKDNAIKNINNYLGKKTAFFASLCIILAFLSWYTMQLKAGNLTINHILNINLNENTHLRSGTAIGLFAALLSIGGLRFNKHLLIASGALLFCYMIYLFINSNPIKLASPFGFSFKATGVTILFLLPGTVNFPTFFRYSRSKADSFLALTLIIVLVAFMELSSLWVKPDILFHPITTTILNTQASFKLPLLIMIIIFTTSSLLVNIYFASACWESIISNFGGAKEYAIIGLLGTAAFTFFQIIQPMQFLIDLAIYFISTLGVILIITFIGSIIRSNSFAKLLGSASWLIGCFTATVLEYQNPNQKMQTLMTSIGISCLFFLVAFFLEETIWSIKRIIKKK